MDQIARAVHDTLLEQFACDPRRLDPNSHIEDLHLDSVDLIELAMMIGRKFDVEIPNEDLQGIERVDEFVQLVRQKLAIRDERAIAV